MGQEYNVILDLTKKDAFYYIVLNEVTEELGLDLVVMTTGLTPLSDPNVKIYKNEQNFT